MTITVRMCGDEMEADRRAQLSGRGLEIIDDLCAMPATAAACDGCDGLVLILHKDQLSLPDLQSELRLAGLDPLGTVILEADELADDEDELAVTVAGATARAAAYPGSSPAHAKPVFPNRFSRRSLFTIPQPFNVAVPAIDPTSCVAGDGCQLCVQRCPEQAYTWIEGRVVFNKDRCEPCGTCITACPTGSITNPAATPQALADQITAVLSAVEAPTGIALRCSRAKTQASVTGWQVVEVPCTGMVTAAWALAPLVLGAALVAVLPCGTTGCDRGLDAAADSSVAFAGSLLTALQIEPGRVSLEQDPVAFDPLDCEAVDDPFSSRAAARLFRALRASNTSEIPPVAGPGSPLGVVSVNRTACTMCTMCSQICPTEALRSGYADDGQLAISFDPTECTACDQCVSVCPERSRGAIEVDHLVDFSALDAGRLELNRSATHLCERCGNPVAPTAMMDRIEAILGDGAAVMPHLTRFCLACRGLR